MAAVTELPPNLAPAEAPFSHPQLMRSHSMSSDYIDPLAPAVANQAVEVQRLFAPPPRLPEQRTVTAQALKRRIPLWLVAVLSAVVGLVAFAVGLFIVTHLPIGKSDEAPPPSVSGPAPSPLRGPGPFGAARSAFAATIGAPVPRPSSQLGSGASGTVLAVGSPIPGADTLAALIKNDSDADKQAANGSPRAPATASAAPPGTTGLLTVYCVQNPCDDVLDNGSSLGPSPVVKRRVAIGSRRLTLVWSGPSQRKVVSAIVMADKETRVAENRP